MTCHGHGKLMISHRRIKHPYESPHAELDKNSCIAPGNGVCDDAGDAIEGDVIYTKTPNEIIDILDMLQMGFWR